MAYIKETVLPTFKLILSRLVRTTVHLLLKPWPLWCLIVYIAFHWLLRNQVDFELRERVDRWVIVIAQVVGAALVLWSLNKNLGLLDEKTWFPRLWEWGRTLWNIWFPQKTSVNITVVEADDSACISVTTAPSMWSLEERVVELERQYNELHGKIHRHKNELTQRIECTQKDLQCEIELKSNDTRRLIELATVKGLRPQIFGALLVMYGALIPVLN
ncbi:hypothetical protein BerOc1_00171 [Pseudodesulfovibrio hydrargyri]|uniref:Uncharacterized protein n=1 Tax=Pseudodesulfovibrio hydrargyri TaxID=2125990 RepID=A0A1J5N7V8_9BACT|nr:hypothetical protein [Pseudodesulfovibrio hydrargyri]OIQ51715.1 hypothetical protein BerOc1_00171 [Pseudodesulfovibrio hydrargyri]